MVTSRSVRVMLAVGIAFFLVGWGLSAVSSKRIAHEEARVDDEMEDFQCDDPPEIDAEYDGRPNQSVRTGVARVDAEECDRQRAAERDRLERDGWMRTATVLGYGSVGFRLTGPLFVSWGLWAALVRPRR